jgi:hypothetical protein
VINVRHVGLPPGVVDGVLAPHQFNLFNVDVDDVGDSDDDEDEDDDDEGVWEVEANNRINWN